MENRRKFLKNIGVAALIGSIGSPLSALSKENTAMAESSGSASTPITYPNQKGGSLNIERILPQGLQKGSKIAIASPASPISAWNLTSAVRTLTSLGYQVEIGSIAKNQKNDNRYFSASDDERADEFMKFIERSDIDAIMCGRGGYGVMRILRKLDYEIIKNNPKIVIGFSDITALLNAIYAQTGIVTFHGPVAGTSFDAFTTKNMTAVIDKNGFVEGNSTVIPELVTINKGKAEGVIQGGNLRLIASTLGTPYEIDTKDSILFLEDVSEHAYEIDRMLTQLLIAGKLDSVKAVVFGKFSNLNVRKSFYPNRAMTILEVINEIFKPLDVPCVYNFPFGHTSSKMTLPLGIAAQIDSETKTFQILEPAVV